jgi:hypothetical protein
MSVSGNVDLMQGRFVAVTATGMACSVTANGDSYSCNLTGLAASTSQVDLQLGVRIATNSALLNITQNTQNLTADVQDIDSSNNTLMSQFLIAAGELSSTAATNDLTPSSAPNNGAGSNVNSSDEDSGGGGGGAFEWYLLFGLLMLYMHTQRKRSSLNLL